MAQWSKDKLQGSDINSGQEFTLGSNAFTLEEINAFINGVLYADENSDAAIDIASNITMVFTAGNPALPVQTTKSIDSVTGRVTYSVTNVRGIQGEQGQAGEQIQLRVSGGYFQWKYTSDTTWTNLIAASEIATVDTTLSTSSTNAIANNAVTNAINEKANKSIKATATLLATGWSSGVQTLSVANVTASNLVEVGCGTLTEEQYTAFTKAKIGSITQSERTLTFTAFGEVPTIDLPLNIAISEVV